MNLDHIPPTIGRYTLPQQVLAETWRFLRERGEHQVEGVVLWVGAVIDEQTAEILAAIPPHQIAYRSELGLAVEIPEQALTELIVALPAGIHVLARVHSHPADAYHSTLDDTNMVISHDGAISIVVANFASGPVTLEGCSVNRLGPDGWTELNCDSANRLFAVR